MNESLQIATGKRPIMSKSQNALLKQMFDCMRLNEPLTLEHLVYIYAKNVKSEVNVTVNDFSRHNARWIYKREWFDVIESYHEDNFPWRHKIKDLIKSWFVSAIGLLVIKGYLKVLPNIDID